MSKKHKLLFIVKRRYLTYPSAEMYGETNSSGLFNSVRFIITMLEQLKIDCKLVQVNDNNDIDREVTAYKPDIVFIEALWVVPDKFDILHKLHPNVTWIIRLHSEMPFMAMEGMSMDWLYRYLAHKPYVKIAANSPRMTQELHNLLKTEILYLPNFYPVTFKHENKPVPTKDVLNVCCFGAVRPLKNHLSQAIAAIAFAEEIGKTLHFHVNATRCEGKGEPILKNVQELFMHTKHVLVEHPWMPHEEFVTLVKQMDIGMQVSFTETYNIVSADLVNNNIPVVTSSEVAFVLPTFYANPTSIADMTCKLARAWMFDHINLQKLNKLLLDHNSRKSARTWLKAVNHL